MANSSIVPVYKPLGLTPLQLINHFRIAHPEHADEKISFAGRLDPMAEGVMILLVGDQSHKEELLGVVKEYDFSFILGIETDTYDLLGKVTLHEQNHDEVMKEEQVKHLLPTLVGQFTQPYPPFSSKPVKGKPLFVYAREHRLNEIEIPSKQIEIFSIDYLGNNVLSKVELNKRVIERIEQVKGDFRQNEILDHWRHYFYATERFTFAIYHAHCRVSSGTYVRSLVHRLGEMLGTGAVTYGITRTQVGEYLLHDCERVNK